MVLTLALLTLICALVILGIWAATGRGISLGAVLAIASFFLGLSIGYCLHLFEDMHTVSGIQWTEGGRRIKGAIRTGTRQEEGVAVTYMVWGGVCTFLAYSSRYLEAIIGVLVGATVILLIVFKVMKRT